MCQAWRRSRSATFSDCVERDRRRARSALALKTVLLREYFQVWKVGYRCDLADHARRSKSCKPRKVDGSFRVAWPEQDAEERHSPLQRAASGRPSRVPCHPKAANACRGRFSETPWPTDRETCWRVEGRYSTITYCRAAVVRRFALVVVWFPIQAQAATLVSLMRG